MLDFYFTQIQHGYFEMVATGNGTGERFKAQQTRRCLHSSHNWFQYTRFERSYYTSSSVNSKPRLLSRHSPLSRHSFGLPYASQYSTAVYLYFNVRLVINLVVSNCETTKKHVVFFFIFVFLINLGLQL